MKLAVVIPAYNEEKNIAKVILSIPKRIKGVDALEVIVVDDNSKDTTYAEAKKAGARVIRHRINLGYGGANITGLKAAHNWGNDLAITIDGDGQHDSKEIKKFVNHYNKTKSNFISGSRLINGSEGKMPLVRVLGNKFFIFFIYLLSGAKPTDSQSGFRLFDRNAMEIAMENVGSGYEFTSELIIEMKKAGLNISEVPIRVIYDETKTGGQNLLNGINIIIRLVFKGMAG